MPERVFEWHIYVVYHNFLHSSYYVNSSLGCVGYFSSEMKAMKIFSSGFFLLLVMLPWRADCQSQEKTYATLILNFARGVQWPGNSSKEKFTIGVLEYPPLASELNTAAKTARVGAKKIEVLELSAVDDITKLDILFIPAYKAKALAPALERLGTDPTLVITNKIDLAKKGSGVNFVLVNGKLKYELNTRTIEARGMKISANIKGMGIIVN